MQITANGLRLEVDVQGPAHGPALLMVMGLGMQLTGWPQGLVDDLVARGYRVVRFDNRDAGLSEGLDAMRMPPVWWTMAKSMFGWQVAAPYTLGDMAQDALGVLDALGIAQAHVCGASMGGMIAQHIAARAPQRVRSLTLIMTSSGARGLPGPTAEAQRVLLTRPASRAEDDLVAHGQHLFTVIGSPGYRPEPAAFEAQIRAGVRRAWRPSGTMRQLTAIVADRGRAALGAQIQAPTQVIHGEADPLVRVACGRDLVQRIAGARGEFIAGMGHDFPEVLLPRFAALIDANAARATP